MHWRREQRWDGIRDSRVDLVADSCVSSEGRRIPHEPAIARFVELSELALDELRAALARGTGDGPRTLLGGLTYADIAASQIVVSAGPPAFGLKLRPAARRCWTDPELREQYGDLVAWRDALYERYRPR